MTTADDFPAPDILSDRLRLISLSRSDMQSLLEDRAESLGLAIPAGWGTAEEGLLRYRMAQIDADSKVRPWLLRVIVLRNHPAEMIGHIGFHGPPDENGAVEIGYSVFPGYRRRGIALEAVEAMFRWASTEHGIHRFVASVSPTNEPSLAMVAKLGFVRVGRQWDEIDGEELVFELRRG